MNTYGWLLYGQTLLALGVLGLCGGWAVWPFRREDRPYLWLAAPLAGVLTLGAMLEALYFLTGLPFGWCLWLGVGFNTAATLAALVRGRPQLPPLGRRSAATAVVLGAAYWGTVSCNKTAIDAREPTLATLDGSDMFGYAITADWIRTHPSTQPPRADEPFQVLAFANLKSDGGRQLAFLLAAAGAECRGTGALFSYDWASGVILAAGMLGFGGAFATSPLMLVLLAAGGGTSSWLANARSGYFAKSIAYPCALMLAGFLLSAAIQYTRSRAAVLAVLGYAVSFGLAPVFATASLGLVAGCLIGALAATYPLNWLRDRTTSFKAGVLKPALVTLFVYAVAVLPAFAVYYLPRPRIAVPVAPTNWRVIIPVALDLEPPALPVLKPETEKMLLDASALILLILGGAALWHRQPAALALLACALVIPLSWLLGQNLLHTFHGVVYPLTLAGAALLATPPAAVRRGAIRSALLVVLVVGMVGVRVPQVRATANRYIYSVQPHRAIARQSETAAIRAVVGADSVDVALGHYADNHLALAEVLARGVEVRVRPPAWDRSLRNWAKGVGCPEPDLLAPKSRYTLMERNAYAPPGTERWAGARLKLVEDRDAVTVLAIGGSQDMLWDADWRPGVWIGNAPTTFVIHNGTGAPQWVSLSGSTCAGHARPAADRRTLLYKLGGQSGRLVLAHGDHASMLLCLSPGLNRVELSVEEPPVPPLQTGQPVILMAFFNWRLEPADPLLWFAE